MASKCGGVILREKNNATALKAGIIGCGRMGALYDERSLSDDPPQTHAKAYQQSSRFELTALCDNNQSQLLKSAALWNVPKSQTFTRVDDILGLNLDVLSVCVPPQHQIEVLKTILKNPPRAIFLEKPVGRNLIEFNTINELLNTMDVSVLINYSRRFSTELQSIREKIKIKNWGLPLNINVNYGKGLLNNGSHALDLLMSFFGLPDRALSFDLIQDSRANTDDPTLNFKLWFQASEKSIPAIFVGHDDASFSIFEIDMLFENGRVRLYDFADSMQIYSVLPEVENNGYRILSKPETTLGLLNNVLPSSLNEIALILDGKKSEVISPLSQSEAIHKTIDVLRRNIGSGVIVKI